LVAEQQLLYQQALLQLQTLEQQRERSDPIARQDLRPAEEDFEGASPAP
jgi:hypothetical protein